VLRGYSQPPRVRLENWAEAALKRDPRSRVLLAHVG